MIINGKEYEIDKNTARVNEWDKVYCGLLRKIKEEGILTENRTGIDTLSIPNVSFSLNPSEELPILESKKVVAKNALSEILWIHQAQSNDVRWLHERNNPIWDEWMISEDGIYRIYEPNGEYDPEREVVVLDLDGKICLDKYGKPLKAKSELEGKTIKSAKYFGKNYAHTIGEAYGFINSTYKRPQFVLEQFVKNPSNRRLIISLWQDAHLKYGVLEPCVWSSEWRVLDGKLHAFIHQRSADTPLGLPFNVIQYSLLQQMFARVSNLEVGNLNWSIVDAHIYVNQLDGINKQLDRFDRMVKTEKSIQKQCDWELNRYLEYLYSIKSKLEVKIENSQFSKEDYVRELEDIKEQIRVLEFMVKKEKPELELANKESFFDFSNQVNNDKEYLKENSTGNEDVKILKYSSLPFIKMPIAQ